MINGSYYSKKLNIRVQSYIILYKHFIPAAVVVVVVFYLYTYLAIIIMHAHVLPEPRHRINSVIITTQIKFNI